VARPESRGVAEERLCAALTRFYTGCRSTEKLSNLDRIVKRYAGDAVVDLWAALGTKYHMEPREVLRWLAETLDPRTAGQWRRGEVPDRAQEALNEIFAGHTAACGRFVSTARSALSSGDVDVLRALAFCDGCPVADLRPQLWRAFLGRRSRGVSGGAEDDGELQQRRREYGELRRRCDCAASLQAAVTEDAAAAATWHRSWGADASFEQEGAQQAVEAIATTLAWQRSRHERGSCRIVAVLLFVMSSGGATDTDDAEADAFWCMSQLMAEVQHRLEDGWSFTGQARRAHELLCAYDPVLAEHIVANRLLPIYGIGAGLFTFSGFALVHCVRIWDYLLGDPEPFEFGDYVIVAMLVLHRRVVLECSEPSEVTEAMASQYCRVDVDEVLRHAKAMCAFERRCGQGCAVPFPPRRVVNDGRLPDIVDTVVGAAQTQLSSLWGKLQAAAWEVGRSAAAAGEVGSPVPAARSRAGSGSPRRQRPSRGGPVALNPGGAGQTILTQALACSLLDFLPVNLRLPGVVEWVLRYTPKVHGVSMATLYRNLAGHSKTVLLVQDTHKHLFGGFAPEPWEPRFAFYGSGEAFVFSFGREDAPQLHVYPWTSRNDFFMYADAGFLAMGGGDGQHAILVRSDLLHGASSPTATFENSILAESSEFIVRDIEVWALEEAE